MESWRAGVELNVLDITTNTTTIYSSIRAGARELDIAHSTILKYAKLSQPYLDKYLVIMIRIYYNLNFLLKRY